MPNSRWRASSTSASVGAVRSVAKMEDLLHYLPHRRQWIELAALHLAEEALQLGIIGDGPLEMRLGAPRRNGEYLPGEVLAPPLLELSLLFEVRAVLGDLRPQLGDILAARRVGEDDRRSPGTISVEREDRSHLVDHRLRRRVVHLVDGDHVGDLH